MDVRKLNLSYDRWAAVAQGVVLNPGELCGCEEPGYFRLCFAWMRDPERGLPTAVQRLARLKTKS